MTHINSEVAQLLQFPISRYFQSLFASKPFFSFRDFATRKQAIDEGYLVNISALSRTFKADVAITRELWELYVSVKGHDWFREQFRAVSLLAQARIAIKNAPPHSTEVFFEVKLYPRKSNAFLNKLRLCAVASSGDSNEPVLTIMLATQCRESL